MSPVTWQPSSSSAPASYWLPLTSVLSSTDSESINFALAASEVRPVIATAGFRAAIATEVQFNTP